MVYDLSVVYKGMLSPWSSLALVQETLRILYAICNENKNNPQKKTPKNKQTKTLLKCLVAAICEGIPKIWYLIK